MVQLINTDVQRDSIIRFLTGTRTLTYLRTYVGNVDNIAYAGIPDAPRSSHVQSI
jgi:hypothetical protein